MKMTNSEFESITSTRDFAEPAFHLGKGLHLYSIRYFVVSGDCFSYPVCVLAKTNTGAVRKAKKEIRENGMRWLADIRAELKNEPAYGSWYEYD